MSKQEQAINKLKTLRKNPYLWCKYFVKITNKDGVLVPFKYNNEQAHLVSNLDKYNIVLKSRQLGITSVSCALSLYYCHTENNIVCILMSYSLESAKGIFEKLKAMYNEIPNKIRLDDVANNKSELRFSNGSRIVVCTCGTKDVSRGLTIRFAHLSEFAYFKEDRAKKNLLALEQALLPHAQIIIESTANGLNNFSEMWQRAEAGESMYKPFFFSWLNDKVMFQSEYKIFVAKYLSLHNRLPTVDELDVTEQHLYDMGASIEQLVWRRMKIANSSEEEFRQEFPSNPIEAFITTGRNVFNSEIIHEKIQAIHPPITTPIGFSSTSVIFWKLPQAKERYYIGVDTSEGIGADCTSIQIIDKDCYQCAELCSNKIKPYQTAELLLKLAQYYNNALCIIEKQSAGHIVVDRMKNMYHYHNLYKSKQYDANGFMKRKAGFETTAKSRPILIGDFVELFESNQLWINSKALLNQMKLFINKEKRMEHTGKSGDDSVFAFGLAIQGIKSNIWYE